MCNTEKEIHQFYYSKRIKAFKIGVFISLLLTVFSKIYSVLNIVKLFTYVINVAQIKLVFLKKTENRDPKFQSKLFRKFFQLNVQSLGTIPLRWMYPTTETSYNQQNLIEALNRQFDGYDEINRVMWLLK